MDKKPVILGYMGVAYELGAGMTLLSSVRAGLPHFVFASSTPWGLISFPLTYLTPQHVLQPADVVKVWLFDDTKAADEPEWQTIVDNLCSCSPCISYYTQVRRKADQEYELVLNFIKRNLRAWIKEP